MEVLITVDNFEEGNGKFREINSPRTLEACLRSGLDPSELYPKPKDELREKGLNSEMLDIKYKTFQQKRYDKITLVRKERQGIIAFNEKKARALNPDAVNATAEELREMEARRAAALIELEEKRLEALKRRQEKELSKIVEREKTMAILQQKIAKAEEEEMRKKKLHDKKVAEEKIAEEKKQKQREAELKRKEEEEAERKRELAKKEAEVEEKLKKKHLLMERQLLKEARERDEERKLKVEEARKKTEALLKAQEDLAEANRLKMLEREHKILQQLEEKKSKKKEELTIQRDKAAKRIGEAIMKHHELHIKKKQEFDDRQRLAEERAKENAKAETERLKKQAEDRDKKNKTRLMRLVDSFRNRSQHRQEIVERRTQKEQVYDKIREEREQQIAMMKFMSDLKLHDKLENVERVSRMNEFRRLQTLSKIYNEDNKYEEITTRKLDMLKRHSEESKQSLIRKHEISDTMERMRMTNDYTLLDKLFINKKTKKEKRNGRNEEENNNNNNEDNRLNQTI